MMRVVLGIGGASGAIYAERLLRFFAETQAASLDIVFSKTGRLVWAEEIGTDPASYGFPIHSSSNLAAPMASGSARFDAMVVAPCSAAGLSRIAQCVSNDLLGRTADVMLKERRRLVLVLRETPLSIIHLRNMVAVTEAGAIILPASPSFYSHPADMTALVDTVTCRVLDQLGIDNDLMRRWTGLHHGSAT
jgi:4-hydroxy-3-polyprenylbenzoate decarboxylase